MEIMTMVGMIMMNMVQAPKEEVAPMSMAMGPPPSRKMTRTPPVYQQVSFCRHFLSKLQPGFLVPPCCLHISLIYQYIVFYQTCPDLFVCESWTFSGGEEKLPRRSSPWQARQCPGKSNNFLLKFSIEFIFDNLPSN